MRIVLVLKKHIHLIKSQISLKTNLEYTYMKTQDVYLKFKSNNGETYHFQLMNS